MPLQVAADYHIPEQPYVDLVPDIKSDVPIAFPVEISHKTLDSVPQDFSKLTPEQLKLYMDRYKYSGMPLRADIKDRSIPMSRETSDMP